MFKSAFSSILLSLVYLANITGGFAAVLLIINLSLILIFRLYNQPIAMPQKFLIILLANCLSFSWLLQSFYPVELHNMLQSIICMFGFSVITSIIAVEKIRTINQILVFIYSGFGVTIYYLYQLLVGPADNFILPLIAIVCMNLPFQPELPPTRQMITKRKIG